MIPISYDQGAKEDKEDEQDIETLMIANTVIFFFAGLDISSTTLTMTMAYLAINPNIQERAYSEIKAALETKDVENIDYEVSHQFLSFLSLSFNALSRIICSSSPSGPDVTTLFGICVLGNPPLLLHWKYFMGVHQRLHIAWDRLCGAQGDAGPGTQQCHPAQSPVLSRP